MTTKPKTTSKKSPRKARAKPKIQITDAPDTREPVQDPLADFAETAERRINISQLHKKTGIDRATIMKWLEIEGVPIHRPHEKEALVDEARAMAVLAEFQSPAGTRKLREFSKARREDIEASRAHVKLQRETGDSISRLTVRNGVYELIKALRFRFVKCYPRDNARRLAAIKQPLQLQRTLETDLDLILNELKNDNLDFLIEGV